MTMFSRGSDKVKAQWEGARTCHQDVAMHFKADDAQQISAFAPTLKKLTSMSPYIYLDVPQAASRSRRNRGLSYQSLLKVRKFIFLLNQDTYLSLSKSICRKVSLSHMGTMIL